jgi:hypothetical protein
MKVAQHFSAGYGSIMRVPSRQGRRKVFVHRAELAIVGY